jgi:hypothetical protein
MKRQFSIRDIIESYDSIISKNRSSFSPKEIRVLKGVKLKLLELNVLGSNCDTSRKRTIIQSIILEVIKILINPITWDKLKDIF